MQPSAKQAGLKLCPHCHFVQSIAEKHCPRCSMRTHSRIPYSIQKTWALIITATIALVPANLLPITVLSTRGAPKPETIMSGIINLFQSDMPVVASVVFIASIVVPIAKLVGLALILAGLHMHIELSDRQRVQMFRFIDFIGRWSMLDLFVLSIMIAVFSHHKIIDVAAGPGATAFGLAVVLTLFAAKTFDTRLIWDYQT